MISIERHIKKAVEWSKCLLSNDLSEGVEDRKEQESLLNGEYSTWRKQQVRRFNQQKIWSNIEKEIGQDKKVPVLRLFRKWQSIAAVVSFLIIGAATYLLLQVPATFDESNVIVPGHSVAYLQINNGETIELHKNDTLLLSNKTQALIDSAAIQYETNRSKTISNEYHTVNVPRNGEFYVKLSDGTKVWVNSASSIAYYANFEAKQRMVTLKGEAYFEVAKDVNRPFIVRTSTTDVRVLGTHFNIKAYEDEQYTYTTLNEGKVEVKIGDKHLGITPNQQLIVSNKSGEIEQKSVDASIYSAWANGMFVFKDERLEDILKALARWYDIDVFYPNMKLKDERFSIRVNRYDKIETLLNHIELIGGVQFKIEERALIVN